MTTKDRRTATEREADKQAEMGRQGATDEARGASVADLTTREGAGPQSVTEAQRRAGQDTDADREAAQAPPTTPPAATNPEPVEIRHTTMTTLGEITHETRPGFDAGGTPVIPNAPLRNRIAEIGDYPRSYEEAELLRRYKADEVDEYGRERAKDQAEEDTPADEQKTEGAAGPEGKRS